MRLDEITTLIELLAYRAEVSAAKTAFTFNNIPCSFSELWQGLDCFATQLMKLGLRQHESVIIAMPNSAEFFFAFYGVQRAGGVAVPIFPGSGTDRMLALVELCDSRLIVLPSNVSAEKKLEIEAAGKSHGMTVLTVDSNFGSVEGFNFPIIPPEALAMIQYTSGSTDNPKGVMLSHANLLTNIRQLIAGMEITNRDVFVSWLPVYHDMGLILKTMVPFYLAAETHLLPTELRDVHPWLSAIQDHKATFTAAPDFAYRLVLSRVEENIYDLSSLRVALNAAEPVRAATIVSFEKRFNLKHVMTSGYGLAEATVGVSMSTPGESPRMDLRGIVSVGKPFPEVQVKIMDAGEDKKPGQIGEIFIASTANCLGYYNNPDASQTLFQNGSIASGDLGYVDEDGYLYITGRKKNIIKHLGRTIPAQELEEIVDQIPGVRYSAAIGIDHGQIEGEQPHIFAEVRNQVLREVLEDLTIQIVNTIHQQIGIRPARVFLLKPHAIPRTYNGKIQHVLLKENFRSGKLRETGSILYPDY